MFEYERGTYQRERGRVTLQYSSQNSRQATFFLRQFAKFKFSEELFDYSQCLFLFFFRSVRADKPTYRRH